MEDAITVLTADHRKMDDLFRSFSTSSGDTRKQLVEAIVRELSIHAAIEEQYLYPALEKCADDGQRLVDHALEEHQKVKETLAAIEGMASHDVKLEMEMYSLMLGVHEHVREEEEDLFARLRAALDEAALRELGESMTRAKSSAPTHPHPHAPNRPPGNVVAGVVTAAVDRARDAISGRGRR